MAEGLIFQINEVEVLYLYRENNSTDQLHGYSTADPGADPGFLDRGFKFREGGSFS